MMLKPFSSTLICVGLLPFLAQAASYDCTQASASAGSMNIDRVCY